MNLKLKTVGWLCMGLLTSVAGQNHNEPAAAPPSAPFTTQIKKAVVFIQTECKESPVNKMRSGTGFFALVSDPRLDASRGFAYLVTNRHVVQPGIEDSKPCNVVGRSVRINLKPQSNAPNVSSELVPLAAGGDWIFPTDDSVDLAVCPVALDDQIFDFQMIPESMFADQKSSGFVEGDPVLFTGLFIQYTGVTRIQPIVRSGSLAMIPDETVQTTLGKPGRIYLTEVHAFGGNSGSPVFVDVGGIRKGKLGYEFKLLGVIAGEVHESADFELQVNATIKGDVVANSGISVVVPADELKKLLDSPPLQKIRDEQVAKIKSKAP